MPETKRPNVLLIWTDEQRADTMACYGNDFIQTPNLNRLSEESFVFKRAYCAQPVCTPSRGTVMTGLWPHTHGCINNNIPLKPTTRTLGEMMPDEYQCAYYGKWHLGDEIVPQHGFDDWLSFEDTYRHSYSKKEYLDLRSDYYHYLVQSGFAPEGNAKFTHEDGMKEPIPGAVFSRPFVAAYAEQYTKAHFLGKKSADYLKARKKDRPFFMSINFLEPHPPFFGPLNDLYNPDDLPVGKAYLKAPEKDHARQSQEKAKGFAKDGYKNHPLKTEWDWRRMRANYYGLVTLVDRSIGMILNALEETGEMDNTIIVFTSDHGEMMGDHGLMNKGVMYDESARIPLLIRVPWLSKEQKKIGAPISLIDLAPTLLDLVDQPLEEQLQGKSRAGVLRGDESMGGNHAIIEWNSSGDSKKQCRSIVSPDGWKMNLYDDDQDELFDLNNDPCELTNRFNDNDQEDRIEELKTHLRAFQKETDDPVVIPSLG